MTYPGDLNDRTRPLRGPLNLTFVEALRRAIEHINGDCPPECPACAAKRLGEAK